RSIPAGRRGETRQATGRGEAGEGGEDRRHAEGGSGTSNGRLRGIMLLPIDTDRGESLFPLHQIKEMYELDDRQFLVIGLDGKTLGHTFDFMIEEALPIV